MPKFLATSKMFGLQSFHFVLSFCLYDLSTIILYTDILHAVILYAVILSTDILPTGRQNGLSQINSVVTDCIQNDSSSKIPDEFLADKMTVD